MITATVALLAVGLGALPAGQAAARLPTTSAKARILIVKAARAEHVSPDAARTVLRRAPYRSVTLRYLFATGWLGGSGNPGKCQLARMTEETTRAETVAAIRADPRVVRSLGAAHVTVSTAADVVTRGIVSACA